MYRVFRATHRPEPTRECALKLIPDEASWDYNQLEVDRLKMFQGHPHILQLNRFERGVLFPHYDGRNVPVFLVDTELAEGGSLCDLTLELMPFEMFDATLCRSYFLQLVSGLQGMHDKGIAHLDLKPDNILLTRESNVLKLADLGLAHDTASGKLSKFLGTDQFAAPEVLRFHSKLPERWRGPQPAKPYDGLKADVFSLGCILFYMLLSRPPFFGKTDDDKIPPGHRDHYPVGGAHAGDAFFQVQCVRITARQWIVSMLIMIALHSCPASPPCPSCHVCPSFSPRTPECFGTAI
jgi:serine/threonine protein kinase